MEFKDIDQKVLNGILADLEVGVLETDVGPMHGIGETTYFRWKKDFPQFKEIVEAAVLNYKKKLIQSVNLNSLKSGRVGQEELRRRYPRDFNVSTKIEHGGKIETNIEDLTNTLQKILKGEDGQKKTGNTLDSKQTV